MKTYLAVAAALALAACASVDGMSSGTTKTASAPMSGTYYCWKEKLSEQGDNLSCNWESNVNDACRMQAQTTISRSSLSSAPTDSRYCPNGQRLVSVTMK